MADPNVLEIVAGFLLVFLVPGYAVTKALFPEWRVLGPSGGLRRFVEILTLSFVLSIVLTVLAGYALLSATPAGFQASWSDPVLEACLAGIALAAGVAGFVRGAYSREPPLPMRSAGAEPETDPFELTQELDRLVREERRIRHELRVGARAPGERERLTARLAQIQSESEEIGRRREAEFVD